MDCVARGGQLEEKGVNGEADGVVCSRDECEGGERV